MENVLVKEEYFLKAASKEIEIKNINGVPYFFIPLNEAFDGSRTVPQFDINTDYVKECEYLKSANESLVNNIEQIGNEIKEIKMSLVDLEKSRSSVGSKKYVITKKRDRRKSGEISRMFSCELCGKSYG